MLDNYIIDSYIKYNYLWLINCFILRSRIKLGGLYAYISHMLIDYINFIFGI